MTYKVDMYEKGKWTTKCTSDIEDKDTFTYIANVTDYEYRIICDGKDVTKQYQKTKQSRKK